MPVTVEPTFFAVTVLLAASRLAQPSALLVWIAAAFLSVLVHELGHAVAARAFGVQARISLHACGGTTSHPPLEGDWSNIAISLAGPISGFVLGAVAWVWSRVASIEPPTSVLAYAQRDLVWINIGWGALNLLPILPLDGGRVMERLLVRHAPGQGASRARTVSIVTAGGLAILALIEDWSWAAILLFWFAVSAWRDVAAERARRLDESLAPLLEQANTALEANRPADTVSLCRDGLARAREVSTRARLAHLLVHAQLRLGDNAGAVEALGWFPPEHPAEPLLEGMVLLQAARYQDALPSLRRALAKIASGEDDRDERRALATALFYARQYEEAATLDQQSFERHGDPAFAYNAACSMARSGNADAAMALLVRAVAAGWSDFDALDRDEDLSALKQRPDWAALHRDRSGS